MPNYPPAGLRALALASSAKPTPNIVVEPTYRPTTTAPRPATTAVGPEILLALQYLLRHHGQNIAADGLVGAQETWPSLISDSP